MIGIAELRSKFLDLEFDRSGFIIGAEHSIAVANAYGEVRAEFTDPSHPDFQACISILASLASGRMVSLVSRLQLYDDAGTHLATTDSRQVIREKSG